MATKNHLTYEKDFYAWAIHTAELVRQKKFSEIDVEHTAEELESMGKSDKRELINRFAVLLVHLLKWHFQPERRSNSWKYTIEEQRGEVMDLLEDSPSLNHELKKRLDRAYQRALLLAATETGMSKEVFPQQCPFSLEQSLNNGFLPD